MAKQTLSVMEALDRDFQTTPDPIVASSGKTKGARSGLPIMEYWFVLFELNELRPKGKKMTNAEISRQMLIEYPTNVSLQTLIDNPIRVNAFRYQYNTGHLVGHRKGCPTQISFRYNDKGEKVDTRTGKALTAEEVKEYIDRFRNWNPKKREKAYKPRKGKKRSVKKQSAA